MEKGGIATLLAAFLVLTGIYFVFQSSNSSDSQNYPIKFYSFEEGFKVAREKDKPVLVYIHSDTCHVCRAFLEDLSRYKDLQNAMNKFVVIKVDFNTERLLAMKFGATGTPEYYVLYPNGSIMEVDGKKLVYIGYSGAPDDEKARKSLIAFFEFAYQQFQKRKG